ncbi:hypothetical protein NP233_g6430 [Leucocoprinus birnbaumii]|uniref:Ribonuclease T2-like n=1 Tax=Leucocoprinus birnbaumii TaxID=56174 RepID=A0AAD5YQX5_9AGAR|nr:hypothetical protein NP233_g6430 [Leucocoprinus birnbaumii]
MLAIGTVILGAWFSIAAAKPLQSSADWTSLLRRDTTISSGCTTSGSASCHTSGSVNTCCTESPGGLLLQTQFWDTNPSTGPSNSWTIHGLWPDNCDGTFEENCDSSRAYTNIASLLSAQGASSTLSFMQSYWVDINGQNEQFWEHEWSTHGTCMSTLEPSCLPSGSAKGAEAVAFFQTVVKLFKSLPTYDWLANAGITPSSSKTYTLSTLTSALKSASGVTPALSCSGSNLNAISWYFNLKGSIIDGTFVHIDAPQAGTCPSSGIKYPLKSGSGTPTTTSSSPTGTGGSLPAKATINAIRSSGSTTGGLLSLGTWSTQTLATFTLSGTASSFTMKSSKGNCGVSGGQFTCGSGVSLTSFSAVSSGGSLLLASGGSTSFSSDGLPSGTTVYSVYTGSSHSQSYTLQLLDESQETTPCVLKELASGRGKFFSVTRTKEEVSVVGEAYRGMPKKYEEQCTWKCIKIRGPMEHSLTGILADLTTPLKAAKVPIFAMSTWNTDYVLVPKEMAVEAEMTLERDGWVFVQSAGHGRVARFSTASGSNGRQKRVLPSRSRRGGPGVGSCDADILILEHQKRRFESDNILPSTTQFFLTTDSKQFSTPSQGLSVSTVSSERYFDRPDVLEGFRKRIPIQTPSFTEGAQDLGKLRPRGGEITQIDTSDSAYERRHRKYESFEKRQRLREKEKLKHEQYKLKERIEQLRVMDSSAFLALPASDFTPAPGVQEGDVNASLAALPGAHVNGAAAYNEGERRRKEMLDIALSLEARFRVLLPPDRVRQKAQQRSAAREGVAQTPAIINALPRRTVSEAEVSEREEEVLVPPDGYNLQKQDKLKIKLRLKKDSTSGSPTPTSASRASKRPSQASLPPSQRSKQRPSLPVPSRSPAPIASLEHMAEANGIPEQTASPYVDVEGLGDQAEQLGLESEEGADGQQMPAHYERSMSALEKGHDMGVAENLQAESPRLQPPTPPQRRSPLPDTRPTPMTELGPAQLENVLLERGSRPPQSPTFPEEKHEDSLMHIDVETLSQPTSQPRLPSPPPDMTSHDVPRPVHAQTVVHPPIKRRGRPPKNLNREPSGLDQLADAAQSLSAGPPVRKRRRTVGKGQRGRGRLSISHRAKPDQDIEPATSPEPPITTEQPLGDGASPRNSPPSPANSSEVREESEMASVPPPEYISSISAAHFDISSSLWRPNPARKGAVIAEYQSETGELRRTDSALLVSAIRGSQRQTQRHLLAFGVKIPTQIADPYDFWPPDEYLPLLKKKS